MPDDEHSDSNLPKQFFTRIVRTVANLRGPAIRARVAEVRRTHPTISDDDLARMLIKNRAFYSGVAGGVTSIGGLMTLPISLPAGVMSSLSFQAEITLTVAHIYGHDLEHEDRALDFLLVLMGNGVHEITKHLSIAAGTRLTRAMVDKVFTREVMSFIWKVVGKQVLTKAGTKSTFSIMKAVPFVAAPIGFAMDYSAARAVGKAAMMFYASDGVPPPPSAEPSGPHK